MEKSISGRKFFYTEAGFSIFRFIHLQLQQPEESPCIFMADPALFS
ncbi:MAG: hypothetical protein HQ542_12785 [Bacteroidia bacterium]|nr:hypothetical protein [Bacteroidia bacterium]